MHQILFDDIARIPEGRQGRNIFLPELVLALDPDQMRKKVVAPHQPFRTAEGQIMRIVSGTVTCRINLEQYHFSAHDIQMSPPDTILELIECSDDFSMQLLVIKSLPGVDREAFRQGLAPIPTKVSLDEANWQMSARYFELLQALLGDGYTPAAGQLILSSGEPSAACGQECRSEAESAQDLTWRRGIQPIPPISQRIWLQGAQHLLLCRPVTTDS